MNWSTKRIIFQKTGLSLLAILFFLSCKKEQNTIGLNDPNRIPDNAHFTDTITVKSEVVLIDEEINTTNVTDGGNTSYLMVGAYTDPLLGKIAATSYSQIKLAREFAELPAASADSAYLFLSYSYVYGNIAQAQTINIHKLTAPIDANLAYYSNSPGIAYDPSPIGTATFNASSDSGAQFIVKITDLSYLQSMLDGSKNNIGFNAVFPGLAFVPSNNSDGAILRIDAGSPNSALRIYFTQYGQNSSYDLSIGNTSHKFFNVTVDRTSTSLSSLTNAYDEINSGSLSNKCYIQALTGLRTKISFPYIKNLREAFPNIAIVGCSLNVQIAPGSNTNFSYNTNLLLIRTENNKIKKDAKGGIFYVQPDNYNPATNTVVAVTRPNTDLLYSFPLRSYMQSLMLEQIPNDPILISPASQQNNISRSVFNDNASTETPIKLNIYFTTTK